MKALVFLILLVCVSATVVPCCSFDNCSEEQTTNNNPEKEKGTCSPFFTCSSCPSGIITTEAIEMPVLMICQATVYQAHPNPALHFQPTSFWQPPKLS